MNELDFILPLVGKPYKQGAAGPDFYDCWGLAQVVQRGLFGREMPTIESPPSDNDPRTMIRFIRDHHARKQWRQVDGPGHGRLVEMCRSSLPFHIGVYLEIDGGGILHSAQGIGVGFDPLNTMVVTGWRGLTFHEWIGNAE